MAKDGDEIDPDESDETEDNESEGASGAEQEEWAPPTKDEWDRTRASLQKANAEAKKHRLAAKAAARAADNGSAGATGVDAGEVRKRALAEAEAAYKPRVIRAQVKAGLLGANLADASDAALKRAVRLIDLDDLDLDDDGDVVGLDEAIAELKESMPNLFRRERKGAGSAVRTGSRGSAGGAGTKDKPVSSASKLAAFLK